MIMIEKRIIWLIAAQVQNTAVYIQRIFSANNNELIYNHINPTDKYLLYVKTITTYCAVLRVQKQLPIS